MLRAALHRHLAVAACYARLSVQSQMEQPLALLSWAILVPFHWLTGIYALRQLALVLESVAGWKAGELTFLYGLALLSHALTIVFFYSTWSIAEWASRGRFAELQVRPLNVYFHFTCSSLNLIGLLDLLPALAILLYSCREIAFTLSAGNMLWLFVLTLAGVLLRVGVFTAVGSLAFWTQRNRGLVGVAATALERTTMYPLTIYPSWLQVVLTVLLPVALVTFVPVRDALQLQAGRGRWSMAALALFVGVLALGAGYRIFARGLAHTDSSGS
jgi:ABC-2 type transport system permease protein